MTAGETRSTDLEEHINSSYRHLSTQPFGCFSTRSKLLADSVTGLCMCNELKLERVKGIKLDKK